jgi:hypothetical protein
MKFRRRRMRLRLIALGLAAAAFGASGAQAAPVIPYLSQGQGLTAEQRAQFENPGAESPKVIPYLSQGQGLTPEQRALLNGREVSNPAGTPCISVSGRCIDIHSKTVAAPAKSAVSRYDDHPSSVVADGSKSSTAINDRIHSRPLPSPADQPSPTATGTDDGFNWGDASVGAGSTLGLVLLAGMAAFTIRRSRRNQLAT